MKPNFFIFCTLFLTLLSCGSEKSGIKGDSNQDNNVVVGDNSTMNVYEKEEIPTFKGKVGPNYKADSSHWYDENPTKEALYSIINNGHYVTDEPLESFTGGTDFIEFLIENEYKTVLLDIIINYKQDAEIQYSWDFVQDTDKAFVVCEDYTESEDGFGVDVQIKGVENLIFTGIDGGDNFRGLFKVNRVDVKKGMHTGNYLGYISIKYVED